MELSRFKSILNALKADRTNAVWAALFVLGFAGVLISQISSANEILAEMIPRGSRIHAFLTSLTTKYLLLIPILVAAARRYSFKRWEVLAGLGIAFLFLDIFNWFTPKQRFIGLEGVICGLISIWLLLTVITHRYMEELLPVIDRKPDKPVEAFSWIFWFLIALGIVFSYWDKTGAYSRLRLIMVLGIPAAGALIRRMLLKRPLNFLHGLGLAVAAVTLLEATSAAGALNSFNRLFSELMNFNLGIWFSRDLEDLLEMKFFVGGLILAPTALLLHIFREEIWRWRPSGIHLFLFLGASLLIWSLGGVTRHYAWVNPYIHPGLAYTLIAVGACSLIRKYWRGLPSNFIGYVATVLFLGLLLAYIDKSRTYRRMGMGREFLALIMVFGPAILSVAFLFLEDLNRFLLIILSRIYPKFVISKVDRLKSVFSGRGDAAAGVEERGVRLGAVLLNALPESVRSVPRRIWNLGLDIWNSPPRRQQAEYVLAAILFLTLGVIGINAVARRYLVRVVEITPSGLVSETVIVRATFSAPVAFSEDLNRLRPFEIEPPLEGTYEMANSRTIIFRPSEALRPSTDYSVRLDAKGLSAKGRYLYGRANTHFETQNLQVRDTRLFFDYDIVDGTEEAVIGEINFNYPVEMDRLRENLTISQSGNPLQFTLEAASVPSRFYFRAEGISRKEKGQQIDLAIDGKLNCIDCMNPLRVRYNKRLNLPAQTELKIEEVKPWQQPGDTFIAIRFNMPVALEELKKYLSVSSAVGDMRIETEYAFAVIRGKFLPNKSYGVRIMHGLRAKNGRVLKPIDPKHPERPYSYGITIRDINPYIRWADEGTFLPLDKNMVVEFKTMNLDSVVINAQKIYRNNLAYFILHGAGSRRAYGDEVQKTEYEIEGGQINEEVSSYMSLKQLYGTPRRGLFWVSIAGKGLYRTAERLFAITDIGLVAKTSAKDLHVMAMSLKTFAPMAGVRVALVSTNNQEILIRTTDENGRAVFSNWRDRKPFVPLAIFASKGGDFSYLAFQGNRKMLQRWDTGGEPSGKDGMEAFVSSDRQLYRPGDEVRITAIVRNKDRSMPPKIPIGFQVYDSHGKKMHSATVPMGTQGIAIFKWKTERDILTGQYSVVATRPEGYHLGKTNVKVEEFIPDKIRIGFKSAKENEYGKPIEFSVVAHQLFGPPAAKQPVESQLRFVPITFRHAKYKEYRFEDPIRLFTEQTIALGKDRLDEQGEKSYVVEVARTLLPPSMVLAQIYTEVRDTGGRPVGAETNIKVHRYPYYLGLRGHLKGDGRVGKPVKISYVAIRPDGTKESVKNVRLVVKRRIWYSIFRRMGWREAYKSSHYDEVIVNKTIDINGAGSFNVDPKEPGEYTVYLGNPDGMRSGLSFRVYGQGQTPESLEDPDKLAIKFDKSSYLPGQEAAVEIRSPFPGMLILTVERDKIIHTSRVKMDSTRAVVKVPVSKECIPNAYVVAMLIRRPIEKYRNLPMVSFGVEPLAVNIKSRQIDFAWEMPKKVKARVPMNVRVKVSNASTNSRVIIAAVDEGILQIVRFKTPDPLGYFYRKQALSTETYSIFEEILPQLTAQKMAVGGGEGGPPALQRRHLNPIAAQRVKSYAFFSGPLKPDANGMVRHKFNFGGFSGEARLMAMAVEGSKFGSSSRAVSVADPIVITPGLPRFLAPDDSIESLVRVFNDTGKSGLFTVKTKLEGPVKLDGEETRSVKIDDSAEALLRYFFTAKRDAAKAVFKFRAEGASEYAESRTEMAVRPAAPLFSKVSFGSIAPGGQVELDVPAGLIGAGQVIRISAFSNPLITYLKSLDYLVTYPHGCAEQTTSKVFPLLYFKKLGLLTGRFGAKANEVDMFIQAGIDKLEKFQLQNGNFTFWPGGDSYSEWLTCYVSHFLVEAQKAGYKVDPKVMENIRRRFAAATRFVVGGRLDRRSARTEQSIKSPYGLYVRALLGDPDLETMRAKANQYINRTDIAGRSLMALAFVETGDPVTARKFVPRLEEIVSVPDLTNREFVSPSRDACLVLAAMAATNSDANDVRMIIDDFGRHLRESGHFGNTHANAWFWIALGRAAKSLEAQQPVNIEISAGGKILKTIGSDVLAWGSPALSGKRLILKNKSTGKAYYHLIVEGTPLAMPEESLAKGISVSREYFNEDGSRTNITNVAQGQLVVVKLAIRAHARLDNVVIVDLLPAGFEIENPRLSSRGKLKFNIESNLPLAYKDIRDDRMILYTGPISGSASFAYTVRAVTPGRFVIPPLLAEAMYEPEVRGMWVCRDPLVVAPPF